MKGEALPLKCYFTALHFFKFRFFLFFSSVCFTTILLFALSLPVLILLYIFVSPCWYYIRILMYILVCLKLLSALIEQVVHLTKCKTSMLNLEHFMKPNHKNHK